jgi:hypothetical protein
MENANPTKQSENNKLLRGHSATFKNRQPKADGEDGNDDDVDAVVLVPRVYGRTASPPRRLGRTPNDLNESLVFTSSDDDVVDAPRRLGRTATNELSTHHSFNECCHCCGGNIQIDSAP